MLNIIMIKDYLSLHPGMRVEYFRPATYKQNVVFKALGYYKPVTMGLCMN